MPDLGPLSAEQEIASTLRELAKRLKSKDIQRNGLEVLAAYSEITAKHKKVTVKVLDDALNALLPEPALASIEEPIPVSAAGTVYSEEELAAAKVLSIKSDIYLEHRQVFQALGYCGNDSLKDAALNANIKRLLPHSSADISTGGSSSGKSKLWDTEEKLIPPEFIVSFTSLSENALNYVGSIENKIFKLGELPPRKPNEKEDTPQWSYLRQLISDNKLERGVAVKADDGKGIQLKKYVTQGPASYGPQRRALNKILLMKW